MESNNAKRKDFTIEDLWNMLLQKGAGRDIRSTIRIWDYKDLIPSNKVLNGLNKIGQGSYGSVYEIKIEGLKFALKIMIQRNGENQQQLIDNFYNECKQLLSVNHERILRIIGVAIDTEKEGEYCFCHYTSLSHKGNLSSIIKHKQLFPKTPLKSYERFEKKVKLLSQIAEGLNAIHAVNLIHRDLKSSNILIDENDSPKIGDFGLADDSQNILTSKCRGTAQ